MGEFALRVVEGPATGTDLDVDGALDLGRRADGSGPLGDDPELSRNHARVTRATGGDLVIQDLGSTNGTYVNGHRITGPEPVRSGDTIELGTTKIEVHGVRDGAQVTAARATAEAQPTTVGTKQVAANGPAPAQPTTAGTAHVAPPQSAPVQPTTAGTAQVVTPPPARTAPPPSARPAAAPPRRAAPAAPAAPAAGGPIGAKPAAITGGGGRGWRMAALALLGLLIAGAIATVIVAASSGSKKNHPFTAEAQGISVATIQPNHIAILDIKLGFLQAPYGIKTLTVHKFLDARTPEPFRVFDGTYTLTATGGDKLVLATKGLATNSPKPPDDFFGRSDEDYTVKFGTGKFKGATGTGKVISVVALDALGRGKGAVAKHFVGTLNLK